uniref:NADH-ubiquinone oxidoreductase chain 2 n=3 Tax=Emoia impar TaxID=38243 RepID=A0A1D8GTL0_EMOIM|nr:NADH dehydrogenase subunit 2 [Emoia impar]AOT82331.1 NADH dehydrogenase subunit 2 [Emoia impar]AOT82340.1 NADH dehydrogenase subunit 2 [Emoia impar]AOT82351.1 NADH dehydrogenase subunit 2 [Emoia impar]AOT82360.1 NADH dehydrogenase subunit 2 [Emoia impar]
MNPIITSLMLTNLAIGTIITMSSTHWLMAWVGLELNTLAIIPIITKHHHPRSTEATTKYFLTQAAASAMLLFASTMNAWHTGTWDISQLTNQPACIMLTMALSMKLGLAPLHFWLPEVLQGTSLSTALIIATWQKLAPMALMFLTHNSLSPSTLLTMGMISALVGGWGGLNQTQTRKIMAFSSIAHLGWMVVAMTLNPRLALLNLTLYLLMTTTTFIMLMRTTSKTIKDLTTATTLSPPTTALMMILLMSMGGLPPLTGFIPKWLILQELNDHNFPATALIMALSALLSLFFYLRLAYVSTLTAFPVTTNTAYKWRLIPKTSTLTMSLMLMASTLLLPITPMLL